MNRRAQRAAASPSSVLACPEQMRAAAAATAAGAGAGPAGRPSEVAVVAAAAEGEEEAAARQAQDCRGRVRCVGAEPRRQRAPGLHSDRSCGAWRSGWVRSCVQSLDTSGAPRQRRWRTGAARRGSARRTFPASPPAARAPSRSSEVSCSARQRARQPPARGHAATHSSTHSRLRSACAAKRFSRCAVSITKLLTLRTRKRGLLRERKHDV